MNPFCGRTWSSGGAWRGQVEASDGAYMDPALIAQTCPASHTAPGVHSRQRVRTLPELGIVHHKLVWLKRTPQIYASSSLGFIRRDSAARAASTQYDKACLVAPAPLHQASSSCPQECRPGKVKSSRASRTVWVVAAAAQRWDLSLMLPIDYSSSLHSGRRSAEAGHRSTCVHNLNVDENPRAGLCDRVAAEHLNRCMSCLHAEPSDAASAS